MDEFQLKGLCYNCDDKYFHGHKCKEQNLFMAILEDVSEDDVEAPLMVMPPKPIDMAPSSDPPKVESVISLNFITGFFSPQTLKLIVYIKNRKSPFLLIVAAPIILFIVVFPKKLIAIFMSSIIFKS
jgi:hypothetical protein